LGPAARAGNAGCYSEQSADRRFGDPNGIAGPGNPNRAATSIKPVASSARRPGQWQRQWRGQRMRGTVAEAE